jgi:hypothetical protein
VVIILEKLINKPKKTITIMKDMLLIFAMLFLFTGCNEEEAKQQETSVYNKWNLIKFEPGLSPTETFSEGKITWLFQQENKLKVEIDNSVSSSPIKSTGEYGFSLNGNRISIGNIEYDYSINENTLIISDDPSSDGFKATFSKAIE